MILLLFFHRFIKCASVYPKISILFTSDSFSSDAYDKLGELYDQHLEGIQSTCDEIANSEIKDDCIAFKNRFINYYISNGIDINHNLKCVSKNTDILYLYTDGISETIDFNNLRSHMKVILQVFDYSFMYEAQAFANVLSGIKQMHLNHENISFLKLTNSLSKKAVGPESTATVLGDMNSSVSFLSIGGLSVTFIGEINCQTLFMHYSEFLRPDSSNTVSLEYVDYYIEDRYSYENDKNIDFIVKQRSYFDELYSGQEFNFDINFENDYFEINVLNGNSGPSLCRIQSSSSGEIGYIFSGKNVNINVNGENSLTYNAILNITLFDLATEQDLPTYEEKELDQSLIISTFGISNFVGNAPEFHLYYDQNMYVFDKTNLLLNFAEHQLIESPPKENIDDDFDCSKQSNEPSTNIDDFSNSINGNDQTSTLDPRPDRSYSFSLSYSVTYFLRRSVSFSFSYSFSNIFMINSNDETVLSHTMSLFFLPYIIYYLSPSYIPLYLLTQVKRRRISAEQLIGITCGSAAIFFFLLYIIIRIVRKQNKKVDMYEWSISDEINDELKNNEQLNNKEHVILLDSNNDASSNDDIDFWF